MKIESYYCGLDAYKGGGEPEELKKLKVWARIKENPELLKEIK